MRFNDRTQKLLLGLNLKAFSAQSWPLKELVILNTSGLDLGRLPRGVRELAFQKTFAAGEAANLLLDSARGEWVLDWPVDALMGPDYIKAHLQEARQDQITTALEQRVYFVDENVTRSLRWLALGLVGHFRHVPYRYEADADVGKFIQQFPRHRVLSNTGFKVLRFLNESRNAAQTPARLA